MKASCKSIKVAAAVMASLSLSVMGFSYAYNPATGMTGDGVLAINPFVWAPSFKPAALGSDMDVEYGFSANVDLFVDLADVNYLPSPAAYNFSWAMLRYDFGANNIIALQASQTFISPQYHFFWENDSWALEANFLADIIYTNLNSPVFGAYLAPVYKIVKDKFSVFLEFDPFYTVGTGFTLAILPGIWVNFGDAGQLSLAAELNNITGTLTPGAALWYSVTFNLKSSK
jgi:hypothetical protein